MRDLFRFITYIVLYNAYTMHKSMSAQVGYPVQPFLEFYVNVSSTATQLLSAFFAVDDVVEDDDRHCVYLSFIISCGFYFSNQHRGRKERRKSWTKKKRTRKKKNSIKFESKLIGFRFYIHSWNLVLEIKKSSLWRGSTKKNQDEFLI